MSLLDRIGWKNGINSETPSGETPLSAENLKQMENNTENAIMKLLPIGAILPTMNSANPSTYLEFGTWERIAEGKTLIGVDESDDEFKTSKKTGGSKTHYHSETFVFTGNYTDATGVKYVIGESVPTSEVNTGAASSLPPYLTCYFWLRTA